MASMASDKLLIMIELIISQAKFEGGGGGDSSRAVKRAANAVKLIKTSS